MSGDATDDQMFADIAEKETFLDRVANGCPPLLAGHELRWSPKKSKEVMNDPEFADLVNAAIERGLDAVEATLMRKAQEGNMAAITMVLFNRRADRWRDVKRIEVRTDATVTINSIESVKAAAIALLADRGVDAMQALNAGTLDEIIDAELVDDDGDD